MIKRIYNDLFLITFLVLRPAIEFKNADNSLWPQFIFIFFLLFILSIKINMHKFTLKNIDCQVVLPILTSILKEKNISYERYENKIILKDYENKEIKYIQSLNSVDIDFNHIKSLPFYKEIEEELRYRIKKLELIIFPYSGLFYIALGIIILVIVL